MPLQTSLCSPGGSMKSFNSSFGLGALRRIKGYESAHGPAVVDYSKEQTEHKFCINQISRDSSQDQQSNRNNTF
jgi:hypothetical protein